MYVQRRWVFATAVLMLVLVGALLAIGIRARWRPPIWDSRSTDAVITADPNSSSVQISVAGPATAFVSGAADPRPFHGCVVVGGGGDTQINIGGFGDIGLQLQNSSISEIQSEQISNRGHGTITASNIGPGNVIINSGSPCPAGGAP